MLYDTPICDLLVSILYICLLCMEYILHQIKYDFGMLHEFLMTGTYGKDKLHEVLVTRKRDFDMVHEFCMTRTYDNKKLHKCLATRTYVLDTCMFNKILRTLTYVLICYRRRFTCKIPCCH
jgi:hypothetical protein